ncbi:MAG: 4Fe-4S binding protein [Bacteroidales bacterium]|nr:4Fe-4S binding protein [Bacteroidales bacterium]
MAQKILIDLEKIRSPQGKSCDESPPEGLYGPFIDSHGLKSIREMAVFQFTCRRCTDAPCISVCPADALEKNEDGIIDRSTNLCISCKSCVVICPFGTMMTDFFEYHRDKENYYDLRDKKELDLFIRNSPEGAVQLVDMEEDPEQNIFKLNDHILVKERMWKTDNM